MGTSAARPDPQPKEGEEGKKERKEKKKSSSDGLEEEALAEWGPLGNVKAFTIASLEVGEAHRIPEEWGKGKGAVPMLLASQASIDDAYAPEHQFGVPATGSSSFARGRAQVQVLFSVLLQARGQGAARVLVRQKAPLGTASPRDSQSRSSLTGAEMDPSCPQIRGKLQTGEKEMPKGEPFEAGQPLTKPPLFQQ